MNFNFFTFKVLRVLVVFSILYSISFSQSSQNRLVKKIDRLERDNQSLRHQLNSISKAVDDINWHQVVGDHAFIDKVHLTGPPLREEKNPTAQGAGNPVKFWAYVFIPKGIDVDKKYPLMVFPHGGVHSNFGTSYAHIVKELLAQQYIIVAPEYRGSTGYGASHYRKIDYGGLEVDDVHASRDFMLENYDFIDKNRVGIMGWSHGGLISLFNIFNYPKDYKVAYAGVPVSDLIARMGYKTQRYRDLYSADYHIGKTAYDNVEEYRKRSPAWHAHKLQTPLLIHTNTNDPDVNVLEVEHLIKSLKAEGKKFEYEIYKDIPGGHSFDRMDTKIAKEIRIKVYNFLAQYLNPPVRLKTVADINRVAYQR